MTNDRRVSPFLKWVGGKRQLTEKIKALLPDDLPDLIYCEPFIGGGAMLFCLQPEHAVVNDSNRELINAYQVVRDSPEELIEALKQHENTPEYFYQIRAADCAPHFESRPAVERASRIIYLNKTCFNGLYRVNRAGKFNVPFGRYKNPNIVNPEVIRAVSEYLNTADIQISATDYETVLRNIPRNSFVYLDPPYHPISESSNFTGYVNGGWGAEDQLRLREACDLLTGRGIRFLLSNSAADFIRDIYADYDIRVVQAARSINSVSSKRGNIDELLIRNYV